MKKLSLALAAVMLVLFTASTTYLLTYHAVYQDAKDEANALKAAYSQQYSQYDRLFSVVDAFEEVYVEGADLDFSEMVNWMINGYIAGTGDRYAVYYTPEDWAQLNTEREGETQGIGVMVTYDPDTSAIQIINVVPGSPAEEAGMLPGDLVVAVGSGENLEEVAVIGYEMALTKLQGESGTEAEFTVRRGEKLIPFSITHRAVQTVSVMYHVYEADPTVGIVKILSFDTELVPSQFAKAVNELLKAGCTRFVMDVRNNPGGYLHIIEAILDALLPEGPVVRTIDKTGTEKVAYESDAAFLNVPIAVLVNENTASAAELFASALQDYAARGEVDATVIGVKTFGKGIMQTMAELPNGYYLKLTNAYYCPPYSGNFHDVGVMPDVVVELDESLAGKNMYLITDEEDNQLAAAIAALNS